MTLLTGTGEWPFSRFFGELIALYEPIKSDLADAIQARKEWRESSTAVMPHNLPKDLSDIDLLAHVDRLTAVVMRSRPKGNLRAAGILVSLQATMEDLRRAVVGSMSEHFGCEFNGVPFTSLLQAGANSCRHGHEWFHSVMAAWRDHAHHASTADIDAFIDAGWSPVQRRAIDTITQALGVDADRASNQPAMDILYVLSGGGDCRLLMERMKNAAIEIARATNRLDDYNRAGARIGNPVVT